MHHRGGTRAIKIGSSWAKCASARRLALAVSPACDFGLMGNTDDTVSSSAKMAIATRMNALACFGGAVSRKASTNTRIRTSSALGVGSSSRGSVRSALIIRAPDLEVPKPSCAVEGVKETYHMFGFGNEAVTNLQGAA